MTNHLILIGAKDRNQNVTDAKFCKLLDQSS